MESQPSPTREDINGLRDVAEVLHPLFEQTVEYFEHIAVPYQTELGPNANIYNLTPQAITFYTTISGIHTAKVYITKYHNKLDNQDKNKTKDGDTVVVSTKSDAIGMGQPALWVQQGSSTIHIYERVPFNSKITTKSELRNEVNDIIDNGINIDWDAIFKQAEKVANKQ